MTVIRQGASEGVSVCLRAGPFGAFNSWPQSRPLPSSCCCFPLRIRTFFCSFVVFCLQRAFHLFASRITRGSWLRGLASPTDA